MQPILSAPSYVAGQFQFTLSGEANATYIIEATTSLQEGWVTVEPLGGSLAPGDCTNVTVLINTNAQNLGIGVYTNTVTFNNLTSGAIQTRPVQLTVQECVAPSVPFGPLPTNYAAGVSVHTLLSWNNSSQTSQTTVTDETIQDATLTKQAGSPSVSGGALEPGLSPLSAGGDNFDRPDGTDMGPDWVERAGDWRIESNRARSSVSSSPELMTFSGTSTNPVLSADVFYTGSSRVTYSTLVSKYADLNNCLFIKVQDNSYAGNFNRAFFYYGNNGQEWPGMTGGPAYVDITPFTSGRITTRLSGDSITLEIDSNFDGVPEQTYTRGGIPLGSLGDGVGLGGYSSAELDNFSVDVGASAMTYDVYFGTNAGALSLIASNLTETTCDPGPLAFNTTYYWQVLASNVCSVVTGELWQFTTTGPTLSCQYNAGSGTMELAWDGTGFRLQVQTNSLGINNPTNWYDYPGGTVSPVVISHDPATPSVFYRLVTP